MLEKKCQPYLIGTEPVCCAAAAATTTNEREVSGARPSTRSQEFLAVL